MTISGNYPSPVYVNGYQCNNCAQVAEAQKDIDPADPTAGPGGINANTPANQAANLASGQTPSSGQSPAVIFGGVLASNSASSSAASGSSTQSSLSQSPFQTSFGQIPPPSTTPGLGGLLNISV